MGLLEDFAGKVGDAAEVSLGAVLRPLWLDALKKIDYDWGRSAMIL